MPASHSCCKSNVPSYQIATSNPSVQIPYQAQVQYLVREDAKRLLPTASFHLPAIDHSPPEAHLFSPSILRI